MRDVGATDLTRVAFLANEPAYQDTKLFQKPYPRHQIPCVKAVGSWDSGPSVRACSVGLGFQTPRRASGWEHPTTGRLLQMPSQLVKLILFAECTSMVSRRATESFALVSCWACATKSAFPWVRLAFDSSVSVKLVCMRVYVFCRT